MLDYWRFLDGCTAQKMKFSIKDFFSKCDQIRWKLRIWSHLLKKSSMENFIFCAVLCSCSPSRFHNLGNRGLQSLNKVQLLKISEKFYAEWTVKEAFQRSNRKEQEQRVHKERFITLWLRFFFSKSSFIDV